MARNNFQNRYSLKRLILEEFTRLFLGRWVTSVQPLFLVKWIEIFISGGFAFFKRGEHGLSSLSTVSFPASNLSRQIHSEHAPSNASRGVHPSENISNEQTIRFEPALYHLDTSSSHLSFSPREEVAAFDNQSQFRHEICYAATSFHRDFSRSLSISHLLEYSDIYYKYVVK